MAEMTFRRLGRSGLHVSVVGLGCNNFGARTDAERSAAVVHAAAEAGITLFDTADVYGGGESERHLGAALGGRRGEALVATKFGFATGEGVSDRGASRSYIKRACEASLRRLGTEWIDLYQNHLPDVGTPLEETLSALDDLVREGKVRYIGCSNYSGWQIAHADWIAGAAHTTPFVSAQNHYNLLERNVEREVVPACLQFGLGILPYFPLASGLLTGKYRRGQPPPDGTRLNAPRFQPLLNDKNFDAVERLEKVAAHRGVSLLHLAIGGLAAQPAVASVIAGATSPEQVRANVEAGTWVPSPDDLAAIDEVVPSKRPRYPT